MCLLLIHWCSAVWLNVMPRTKEVAERTQVLAPKDGKSCCKPQFQFWSLHLKIKPLIWILGDKIWKGSLIVLVSSGYHHSVGLNPQLDEWCKFFITVDQNLYINVASMVTYTNEAPKNTTIVFNPDICGIMHTLASKIQFGKFILARWCIN